MRFVDLSGFMFSGKAAVSDLLREVSGVHVPYYRDEFDLLRLAGGLIDLKNAVEDWSPVRTHAALNRFERTVRRLADNPGFPEKLFHTGWGYAKKYPNLLESLDRFLGEAVVLQWETPWPYDDLEDGPLDTLRRKLARKLGRVANRSYRLTSREAFYPAAQEFLRRVLGHGVDLEATDWLVTHNALEPFDPANNLRLFGDDAKCIVVDRDPRDIYATAVTTQSGFNDSLEFYKQIAGAHRVDLFIERYKLYRRQIGQGSDRVLRVELENLINYYQGTVSNILDFLEVAPARHQLRRKHFDPELSRKNTEQWKNAELKGLAGDFERIAAECRTHLQM